METSKILLIGQLMYDIHIQKSSNTTKNRLGGIAHAMRALHSIDSEYRLAYFAPKYLEKSFNKYCKDFKINNSINIGEINGSPCVQTIWDSKELGDQNYEFYLNDYFEIKINYNNLIDLLDSSKFDYALIFSGEFNIEELLNILGNYNIKIAIDANFNLSNWNILKPYNIEELIISTSSEKFINNTDVKSLMCEAKKANIKNLMLKENRGGTRYFDLEGNIKYHIGAQLRKIEHSVGVGDCYDSIFLKFKNCYGIEKALNLSSIIAAEYASTYSFESFIKNVKQWLDIYKRGITNLKGIKLAWEERSKLNIYIAAPDFKLINTEKIEIIARSLKYHNFKPRRPILENGEMNEKENFGKLVSKDMILINECDMMLVVLLYNDPGTLIELGIAIEKNMPVFVYDPFKIAKNLMLTELPNKISDDFDEILIEIFKYGEKILDE